MPIDLDSRTVNSATKELAAHALSLPLFLIVFILASLSLLISSRVDWLYPAFFFVLIPAVVLFQAVMSPTDRGGFVRLVFFTIMITLGLTDSSVADKLGTWGLLAALGAGSIGLFASIRYAKSGAEGRLVLSVSRHPRWMLLIWVSVPVVALAVATALRPILLALYASPPQPTGGWRFYDIPPSHIKFPVFLNWFGFVVFTVAAGTGLLRQQWVGHENGDKSTEREPPAATAKHRRIRKIMAIALLPFLAFFALWGSALFFASLGLAEGFVFFVKELTDVTIRDLDRFIGETAFIVLAIIGSIAFPLYLQLYFWRIRSTLQTTKTQECLLIVASCIAFPFLCSIAAYGLELCFIN